MGRDWGSFLVDLLLPLVLGSGLTLAGIWVGILIEKGRGR